MARPRQNNTTKVVSKDKSAKSAGKGGSSSSSKSAPSKGQTPGAGVRKPHKFRPGTVAMRATRRFQREAHTRMMLPRAPFRRIMKNEMVKISAEEGLLPANGKNWISGQETVDNIHTWLEHSMIYISKKAVDMAVYSGRKASKRKDVVFAARQWAEKTGFALDFTSIEETIDERKKGIVAAGKASAGKNKKAPVKKTALKRHIAKPEKYEFTSAALTRLLMVGGSVYNTREGRLALGIIAESIINAVLRKTLVVAHLCKRSCVSTKHFMGALKHCGLAFYPHHGLERVKHKKKKTNAAVAAGEKAQTPTKDVAMAETEEEEEEEDNGLGDLE